MEELGDQLGMSRVQLSTSQGEGPDGHLARELLREMRPQRLQSAGIDHEERPEIAFEVGFNTPSYFSNCFKAVPGKYPTDPQGRAMRACPSCYNT